MKGLERRTFVSSEMRVVRKKDESPKIVGHAAVFNSPTEIGSKTWGWLETIAPGAFTESIEVDDIRGLFNHDPNIILGRNMAGTLRLEEDKKGLRYEIDPPDTEAARGLLESIDRGDITGSSFGFEVLEQHWTIIGDDDEWDKRQLTKLKLWDVSPVTFPAYDDTDVGKRQYQEQRDSMSARQTATHNIKPEARQDDEQDWRVIPFSRHGDQPTQDVDTEWDGPAERTAADVDQLKMMSLFEDKEHLDAKSGFKGHHHTADGNKVNWNGVRAVMGVLRGARGGFKDIPTDELSKGYDHTVKHYKEFDKEPPENPFRSKRSNRDKMEMRLRLST